MTKSTPEIASQVIEIIETFIGTYRNFEEGDKDEQMENAFKEDFLVTVHKKLSQDFYQYVLDHLNSPPSTTALTDNSVFVTQLSQLRENISKEIGPAIAEPKKLFDGINVHSKCGIEPGDIVLSKRAYKYELGTELGQGLTSLKNKGGHSSTVSAQIAMGSYSTYHFVQGGLTQDSIIEKRSYIIFRAKNIPLKEAISSQAKITYDSLQTNQTKPQYSAWGAITSIFSRKNKNTEVKNIEEDSFCSQFVINTIKKASKCSNSVSTLDSVSVNTSPRALESYLRASPDDFKVEHKVSLQGVKEIQEAIEKQYVRLSKGNQGAQEKAEKLREALKGKNSIHITDLLKEVMPILAERRGGFEPKSFKAVMKVACKHGYGGESEIKKWVMEKVVQRIAKEAVSIPGVCEIKANSVTGTPPILPSNVISAPKPSVGH